jgi:GTP cyclohydrolase I
MSPSPRQDERLRAEQKSEQLVELTSAYKSILRDIGENPEREGLRKTPERAAKALLYFIKGYDEKISGNSIHTPLYLELPP